MSEKNIIDTAINNFLQDRKIDGYSLKWANWMSKLTLYTCFYCAQQHGKIFDISILEDKTDVNAHERCWCEYVPMRTKKTGTATDLGMNGADAYIARFGMLPDYYVDKQTARQAGWQTTSNKISSVLPGKMVGAIYMLTTIINCQQPPDEFGMRRILIMLPESGIARESYIPMTV